MLTAGEPLPVMYLDFDSSMADLRERAWSFGATPDELDRLAYYLQTRYLSPRHEGGRARPASAVG